MKICVTKKDILLGNRESENSCPVALALLRNLKKKYVKLIIAVHVQGRLVQVWKEHGRYVVLDLGDTVSKRIGRYDMTGRMQPFAFKIDTSDLTTMINEFVN